MARLISSYIEAVNIPYDIRILTLVDLHSGNAGAVSSPLAGL